MRALVLVGFLVAPVCAWAGIGDKLADRQRGDFFSFFHWQDGGRSPSPGGTVRHFVQGTASMFHGQVALDVTVDGSDHITAMELRAVRGFTRANGGVFARDAVSSFLKEACEVDIKEVEALLDGSGSMDIDAGPTHVRASWTGDWLTIAVTASAPSKPAALVGVRGDAQWHALFLTATDLPGMRMTQDTRDVGPDQGDDDYAKLGGLHAGFAVWMASSSAAPVWRVVDIRVQFPTEAAASAYLGAHMRQLSEGTPAVAGAAAIGQDTHVFGGTRHNAILDADMTDWTFVFRTGAVVSKIYVAAGPEAKAGALTEALASGVAVLANARVTGTARPGAPPRQAPGSSSPPDKKR